MEVINTTALPDDVNILKRLLLKKETYIREQARIIDGKKAYIGELEKKNEQLSEQLILALRFRYARSSEKWTEKDKNQLRLFNEAETTATIALNDTGEEIIIPTHTRGKKRGRKPLSDALPRNIIKHELDEDQRRCRQTSCPQYGLCKKLRPVIGCETTEELEFIPATIQVNRHEHYSYGQIACDDFSSDEHQAPVIRAEKPKRLIEGSIVTPSLLSYVVVSKFADALPLYRLERIFKRIGIEISRQTMSNWIIQASGKIERFIELLWEQSREGPLLNIDETTVQVLKEPSKPVSSKSYMWVLVSSGEEGKTVLFKYFRNRSKAVAMSLLEGYEGAIQTDGYQGYNAPASLCGIWHVGCWSHYLRSILIREDFSKAS